MMILYKSGGMTHEIVVLLLQGSFSLHFEGL